MTVPPAAGRVYIVATPIGNLEDVSSRALRVLREVDCIACEDTRHTARLCARFEIGTRRVSLHAHNEQKRTVELLARLERGEQIAVVSDAGTPLVSDPGARFVRAAIDAGYPIEPIPGASAVLAALVASGFDSGPFTFVGFLPRRGTERRERLASLQGALGTLILFEAPARVTKTLADLHHTLGERRVVVARELTKRHEELVRGRLGSLDLEAPRGEVTLVIEAGDDDPVPALIDPTPDIDRLLNDGLSPRDAAREIATTHAIPRTRAYTLVQQRLRLRSPS